MSNLVKFGSYTADAADQEQKQLNADSGEMLKLNPGKNVLRVLPPAEGQQSPFATTYQHFVKNEAGMVSVNCPRMMLKKPCPLCNFANTMRNRGSASDRDTGFQYLPKRRIYASVIDRRSPEAGPKVFAFGKMIHEALLSLRKDEDWGDFSHPIDGFDITIEKSGEGLNTDYRVNPRKHGALAQTDEQMNEWLGTMPDLARFAYVPSVQEITKKLGAIGFELEGQMEGLVEKRSTRAALPAGKKPTRTVEADLDDDDVKF